MDNRNIILAKNIISHSVKLQKGEKVLIEARGTECEELVNALIEEAYKIGALPFVIYESTSLKRELLLNITEEQVKIMADANIKHIEQVDAYILLTGFSNAYENSDVPVEKLELFNKFFTKSVHYESRLKKKWVVLRYPTLGLAQAAKKSLKSYKDFFYKVCNLDYKKMDLAMEPLKKLMESTDIIRITGKGTDISFSIKDMPIVKCAGQLNIPDGEICTAPVKTSVNGYVTFNTPSIYDGFTYENIQLQFKDGKVINSTANDAKRITGIFNMDEGARYIGEFSLGVNPYITDTVNNDLFDEKIKGSFHLTAGLSYQHVDNTNRSSLRWSLVCIQTPEYGGGEIYFDDVLVRRDGRFVLPELHVLNPEYLI